MTSGASKRMAPRSIRRSTRSGGTPSAVKSLRHCSRMAARRLARTSSDRSHTNSHRMCVVRGWCGQDSATACVINVGSTGLSLKARTECRSTSPNFACRSMFSR